MWKKLSTWEMWRKSVMWRNDVYNLWCFVALNYYKISFLAIYAVLLRFFVATYSLFCGEKLSQKLCLWRKKDKYHVWLFYLLQFDHIVKVTDGVGCNCWRVSGHLIAWSECVQCKVVKMLMENMVDAKIGNSMVEARAWFVKATEYWC